MYYKAYIKYFPILLYYKICKNYFPILFYITKLAKIFPNTTLYYTICTNYFPILYTIKACIKHFPILLCTTKLAQFFSHYYRVLESLYRALPSTVNLLEKFRKRKVLQFPGRHGKIRDSKRNTWTQQNTHFVRDFFNFAIFDTLSNRLERYKVLCLPRKPI